MVRFFVPSCLSLLLLASDALAKPVVTKSTVVIPSCPAANGLHYDTPAGTYVVQCSVSAGGQNLPNTGKVVANFQACVDQCAGTSKCVAVHYKISSRSCTMKSTYGASTSSDKYISAGLLKLADAVPAPVVVNTIASVVSSTSSASSSPVPSINVANLPVSPNNLLLSSAGTVNLVSTLACPGADGTKYVSTTGTFQIACGYTIPGADVRGDGKPTISFQACVDQCSALPACKAVSWLFASGKCYLKTSIGAKKVQKTAWSAVWVGGLPLPPVVSSSSRSSSSSVISSSGAVSSISSVITTSPSKSSSTSSVVSTSSTSSSAGPSISSTSSFAQSSSSTTSSISSSSPSAPASSTVSSASGVESVFSGPTVIPGPPHALLGPIAPFNTDMGSMEVIAPAPVAGLFYSSGSDATNSTGNSTAPGATVAKLSATFQYPSVVLDHSIYITASCSGGVLTAVFSTLAAYNQAQSTWPTGTKFVLVTADPSCGDGTQNSFFLASSVAFSTSPVMEATAPGTVVDMVDIIDDLGVDFGTIPTSNSTASNSTGSAYMCGSPSSDTIGGLPAAPCGPQFDQTLDDKLGYYSGADADIQTVVAEIAPGAASTQSALQRRKISLSLKSITKAVVSKVVAPVAKTVVAAAKTVAAPLAKVLPTSVKSALASVAKAATSVVTSVASTVASALTGSFSQTMTLPINLAIPASMLSSSPWGQQFKFYSFGLSKSDPTYAAAGATLSQLSSSGALIGTGSNPSPGVELFCVDCGVTGQLQGTGSLGISLTNGFYKGSVALTGHMQAGLNIGVNGFASYSATKDVSIIQAGLPGFSIPKIVTIGPSLSVNLNSNLQFNAIGQILVGATYSWPAINAVLDVIDSSKSTRSGFTPTLTKTFQAYGDVLVTAHVELPVSVEFGLNVLNGKWVKSIALVNTPAVDLSAELFVSYGSGTPANPTGCNGVAWSVNVSDNMALTVTDLVNYSLFSWQMPPLTGCIGRKLPVSVPSAASSTANQIGAAPSTAGGPAAASTTPYDSGSPVSTSVSTPVSMPSSTPTPSCYGTASAGPVTDTNGEPYVVITGALLSTSGAFATVTEPSLAACLSFCKTWGPTCQFAVYDPFQLRTCALLGATAAISLGEGSQSYAYSNTTTSPAPYCGPVLYLPSPSASPVSSTTTTSSAVASTSSAAPTFCPVPTSAPKSLGCYYTSIFTTPFDSNGDLIFTSSASAIASIEGCIAHCNSITSTFKTFSLIGLSPGYCFCETSATLSPAHQVADSLCATPCSGNGAENCGGVGDQATFEYTVVYANTLQGYAGCVQAPAPSQLTAPAQINCFNNYNDGAFYKADNGNVYQIHCHMYPSGDDIQMITVTGSDACVNLCSTTASCVAAAWVASASACFLKSVRSPLPAAISDASQGKEVDMIVLVSAPPCSTMTCPAKDGSYCMSNGNLFQISCYTWYQTSSLGSTTALSLGACMDYCTSTFGASCHGANFFTTTGSCAPFSVANTPNPPFVTSNGGISAIDLSQLNQGFGPHPLALSSTPSALVAPAMISCSSYGHDGASYTTGNGVTYQISCHAGHFGDDLSKSTLSTFDQCIDACSHTAGCVAVDWIASQNGCLLKSGRTTLPGLTPDTQPLPKTETTSVQCYGSSTIPASLASGPINDQDGLPYTIVSGALLMFASGQPFATAPEPSMYNCLQWCNSWGPMCAIANFDPNSYQSCQLFQFVTSIYAANSNQGYAYKRQPANIVPTCAAAPTSSGGTEVDSALMISAPSCDSISCPSTPAGSYCSSAGMIFEISCDTVYGTNYFSAEVALTLGACLDICAAKGSKCLAVDFYPPYYPGENSCLLVSTLSNPTPAGDRYGGFSAISLASLAQGFGPVNLAGRDVEEIEVRQIEARVPSLSPAAASSTTSSSSSTVTSSTTSSSLSTAAASTTSSSSTSTSSYASAATSSVPSNGLNTTIATVSDTTGVLGLNAAVDGNLFISVLNNPNTTNTNYTKGATDTFSFVNSTLIGDTSARLLHYFPQEMTAAGASRMRVAEWGNIPLTATLLSLVPFPDGTGNEEVLVGLDTLGNYYWLFMCDVYGYGNKVFLAKDQTYGGSVLQDPNLKFTVTGGDVNDCEPLALVEGAMSAGS